MKSQFGKCENEVIK